MKQKISTLILFLFSVLTTLPVRGITLSTWNMEWLTLSPSSSFPASDRTSADFTQLHHYFVDSKSTILAFQEVDSIDAIQKIVGKDYQVYLSDRAQDPKKQFKDINQYTGFAVHHSINVTDPSDFSLINNNDHSKLRYASYLIATIDNQPIHLLSVHLKAGCYGKKRDNKSCATLEEQSEKLIDWINNREKNEDNYLILGDINHTLTHPNSWLWHNIQNQTKAHLLTQDTKADCFTKQWRGKQPKKVTFRHLIDHGITNLNPTHFNTYQQTYKKEDIDQYQLSDHCPILFEFN